MINFYKTLDVAKNASESDIKKAYRKLAQKWHPDRHVGDKEKAIANKKFQEIQEAYATLSDKSLRENYDRSESYEGQQSRPWSDEEEKWRAAAAKAAFADFFKDMDAFGDRNQNQNRNRDNALPDITVSLSPIQADIGGEFTFNHYGQSIKISVPSGSSHGTIVKSQNGNLRVMISMKKSDNPNITFDGSDVFITVNIPLEKAIAGHSFKFNHWHFKFNSPIFLDWPPIKAENSKLRLKGYGLTGRTGRGDLYFVAKIDFSNIPKNIFEAAKKSASTTMSSYDINW
jgi:curved DNA-binding protein